MKKIEREGRFILFFIPCFVAWFFIFPMAVFSADDDLVISEIMYDPQGSNTGHSDWIELYNSSAKKIAIKKDDFGLIDEKDLKLGTDGKHYLNCHGIKEDLEIGDRDFLVLADDKSDFEKDYSGVDSSKIIDTTFDLSSSGDYIRLSNDKCETFFIEINYENSWGGKDNGKTLEKIKLNDDYSKDAWQESYIPGGTPGENNSEKPKPKEYSKKIRINEILPNPSVDESNNEFIELYNFDESKINLENWILKDSSKTGKYIFSKDAEVKADDFFAVHRKDYKFSLNNTGNESVYLFNPNEEKVSEVDYSGGPENVSYNFDGKDWRWSRYLTPGEENKFDTLPEVKIIKDKEIYENMYANFEADVNNYNEKDSKFTWDFGDGHKSYLSETRHKYESEGTFQGSLKVFTGSENIIQNFIVTVEKYPKTNVVIIGIDANPSGKDTENEWLMLENKEKKKVNLKNWSVATGWDELYNHPINDDFEIAAGKTKKLTRKDCAFTLNNQKTKIELRYPNGDVASKLKYSKDDGSIAEEELYEKNNKVWAWRFTPGYPKLNKISTGKTQNKVITIAPIINSQIASAPLKITISSDIGKRSIDTAKEQNKNKMLNYNLPNPQLSQINTKLVLGAAIIRTDLGYQFTQGQEEEHYAVTFFKKMMAYFNSLVNGLINQFSN